MIVQWNKKSYDSPAVPPYRNCFSHRGGIPKFVPLGTLFPEWEFVQIVSEQTIVFGMWPACWFSIQQPSPYPAVRYVGYVFYRNISYLSGHRRNEAGEQPVDQDALVESLSLLLRRPPLAVHRLWFRTYTVENNREMPFFPDRASFARCNPLKYSSF